MSVAEKLEALGTSDPELVSLAKYPDLVGISVADAQLFARLFNTLPQIVAVVEAAEQLPMFFDVDEQVHSFVPLLDALDEALGEDVT